MTNSQKVRAKFPRAVAEEYGGVYWIVTPRKYGRFDTLGEGHTVKLAWEDAAYNLEQQTESRP